MDNKIQHTRQHPTETRQSILADKKESKMKHKEQQLRNAKGNTLSTNNYKGDKRILTRAGQEAHRIAVARHKTLTGQQETFKYSDPD